MPMRPSKTPGGNRLKGAYCVGIFRVWFSWPLHFITNRARTSSAPALYLTVPWEIFVALKIRSLISTSINCASILRIGNGIFHLQCSVARAPPRLVSRDATLLLSDREPTKTVKSRTARCPKISRLAERSKFGFRFTSCRPPEADPSSISRSGIIPSRE